MVVEQIIGDFSSNVDIAQMARGSGLRNIRGINLFVSDQDFLVDNQAVGGAGGAAVTTFTTLTDTGLQRIQMGSTLVAQVVQGTPVAGTISLRVEGYDQFGVQIVETTPTVTLAAVTNNYIYLAKVFAVVTLVQFQSTGLDSGSDTINVGTRYDWAPTNDASNNHIAQDNLGLATPVRLGFRPSTPPSYGRGRYQLDGMPRGLNASVQELALTEGNNAVAGEDVTIDGQQYNWQDPLTPGNRNVQVGPDGFESMRNLIAAINLESQGEGTQYGLGTVAHPTVVARAHPKSGVAGIQISAKLPGVNGSLIPVSENMTNAAWEAGHGTLVGTRMRLGRAQTGELHVGYNTSGFPSVGYLTFTGQPGAGEQVAIGAVTYTFVAAPAVANDVDIGATTNDSIDNLVSAINDTGVEGTNYGTGTVHHPLVGAERRGSVLRVFQKYINGRANNTIATTTDVTGASWGAATMQGGSGASSYISDAFMRVGFNEAGWEGSIDKFRPLDEGEASGWYEEDGSFVEGWAELVEFVVTSLEFRGD